MKFSSILAASVALVAIAQSATVRAEEAPDAQVIVVTAPRVTRASATDSITGRDAEPLAAPDAEAFIARLPGAALVGNGALSGQVQLRGLFGERVLLTINGQHFGSGGPNAMDPAMHYAPMVLVDRLELARGISPVRDGPGLGGAVNVVLKTPRFASGPALSPQIDLTSQFRSADNAVALGGLVALANDRVRAGLVASWEQGDDLRIPGGRIGGSSHRRAVFGAQAGLRLGEGELGLEYRRQQTGRSGNPPFAMDIVYFHTDFLQARFEGDLGASLRLEAQANFTAVDHRMNNFSLRPSPVITAVRQSDTSAETIGSGLSLRLGSAERHLRLGADFEHVDKAFRLYNPLQPAFSIMAMDRGRTSRYGAYAELRGALGAVQGEVGLRVDRHSAAVDAPHLGAGVPAGPANLARLFGLSDRDWRGTTVDGALRLWADRGAFTPRLTLAHKTRVPSLVERFGWLPTEASGGLADGNIYVGGGGALKPERAWLAEAGFDWSSGSAYARPAVFWRRIHDFIQGVPYDATPGTIDSPVEMVAAASGDATPLRFANVEAELWGTDLAFGARLAGPLRIDGVASVVRGRRLDIADNLYRIAPASLRLALGWEAARWGLSLEGEAVDAQDRVAASNSEARTAGRVTAALHGHWLVRDGLRIDAGVENLFNRKYVDHLAGYNRNAASDVALGSRLPGAGLSAYVRLRLVLGGN